METFPFADFDAFAETARDVDCTVSTILDNASRINCASLIPRVLARREILPLRSSGRSRVGF